jgi:hypothetical protein
MWGSIQPVPPLPTIKRTSPERIISPNFLAIINPSPGREQVDFQYVGAGFEGHIGEETVANSAVSFERFDGVLAIKNERLCSWL